MSLPYPSVRLSRESHPGGVEVDRHALAGEADRRRGRPSAVGLGEDRIELVVHVIRVVMEQHDRATPALPANP